MNLFKKIIFILLCYPLLNYSGICFSQQEDTVSQTEEVLASTQGGSQEEASPAESPASTENASIMEIKPLDEKSEKPLYSFELREVEIGDLFRVLAHDYKLNLLVDKEVSGTVTASLSNVSLDEALENIAESRNLILKKRGNITRVSLNLITKTFTLKYIEANKILGSASSETASSTSTESASTAAEATTSTQANTIYDLISDKGKVLIGSQPNSIIVIDYPSQIAKIEEYINQVDQKVASRVFKLKYLKAADVVGESPSSNSSSTGSASSSTSAESSSSSGGS